jgi:predicted ester cyclase/ketosteroid isomerase-like protein
METLESTITGAGEIQDQNKAIVREFFAAVDNQDFEKLDELLAGDFVLRAPVLTQTWTKEDVFNDIRRYYTAFPDWKHSIEELVAEGDKVAVQVLQRGTHAASFEEIEPTGMEVTKPGIHIITIIDCKIGEWWGMEEELGFMLQLGMELRKKDDLAGNEQTATIDIEKEKAAVSGRFDQLLRAIEKEDVELLEKILCGDADLIFFGTDANERWVGKKALIAAHKEFFRATSDSSMEIYNKTIHISLSGTVAWTSCMMNWDITSGGQSLNLKGLRLTMVFEKRDDEWFAVQTHGSIPPSGQSIEY